MITEADLKKFAPKMKAEYKRAFAEGQEYLEEAGIYENERRICHFMATFGAETGYGTIIRESLYYTRAQRLREVWPSRFRDKSDAALRPLLKNERALGDAVYMGRMGNTKPGDGYIYRGGGPGQTTGKSAVKEYAEKCGLACDEASLAGYLDDCLITLRFICHEWVASGCNQWADENDVRKVAKAINTGSAHSKIAPVGMDNRREAFAKAWGIWGDKGKPDNPKKKAKIGKKEIVAGIAGATAVNETRKALTPDSAPSPPQAVAEVAPAADPLAQLQKGAEVGTQMQSMVATGRAVGGDAISAPLMWGILLAAVLGIWCVVPLINKIRGTS